VFSGWGLWAGNRWPHCLAVPVSVQLGGWRGGVERVRSYRNCRQTGADWRPGNWARKRGVNLEEPIFRPTRPEMQRNPPSPHVRRELVHLYLTLLAERPAMM